MFNSIASTAIVSAQSSVSVSLPFSPSLSHCLCLSVCHPPPPPPSLSVCVSVCPPPPSLSLSLSLSLILPKVDRCEMVTVVQTADRRTGKARHQRATAKRGTVTVMTSNICFYSLGKVLFGIGYTDTLRGLTLLVSVTGRWEGGRGGSMSTMCRYQSVFVFLVTKA